MGNVTMQIDAYRDQIELYDDAEDADEADEGDVAGGSVAPPPLPPRGTHAPTPGSPAPNASGGSKVGVIAIGVVVAAAAVGAALWLSGMLVEEPPATSPEPSEPPALEIGPIEIDTTAP
ncbi:MAG: hypothetical protein MUE69_23505 [Myxococcota bacterium]|nr:hypothetical protein [Myxococcota bacterium]